MEISDIPYDILFYILIDVKNLKELVKSKNINLYTAIRQMFKYFNGKFKNLFPEWKENYEMLAEILAENNDFEGLKFLGNNFKITHKQILRAVAGYGSYDLLLDVIKYFNIGENKKDIIHYAMIGDNLAIFEKYNEHNNKDIDIEILGKHDSLRILNYIYDNYGISENDLVTLSDIAVRYGYLDLFKFVQSKNIDTENAVLKAIDLNEDIVKYAVDQGLYLNTILQFASYRGKTELIKYVIERGGDPNILLINAASTGHFDQIKYALENGANEIRELAEIISESNYYYISEYIIEKFKHMKNILNIFSYNSVAKNNCNIVELAFKNGANNQNKVSAYAAFRGYLDIVKIAFKYGADNPTVCVINAIQLGYFDVIKFLNENYKINKEDALNAAISKRRNYIIDYLRK